MICLRFWLLPENEVLRETAKIGVSQSALSHRFRLLEAKLGVRLLTRTTRAVSPTEAGERLLNGIGPQFDEIEAQIDALNDLRDKPAGTIRISASDHAIEFALWPKLKTFLSAYPDIKLELIRENGLTDTLPNATTLAYEWATGCKGHDFRSHRPGHAFRGRRGKILL